MLKNTFTVKRTLEYLNPKSSLNYEHNALTYSSVNVGWLQKFVPDLSVEVVKKLWTAKGKTFFSINEIVSASFFVVIYQCTIKFCLVETWWFLAKEHCKVDFSWMHRTKLHIYTKKRGRNQKYESTKLAKYEVCWKMSHFITFTLTIPFSNGM